MVDDTDDRGVDPVCLVVGLCSGLRGGALHLHAFLDVQLDKEARNRGASVGIPHTD